MPGPGGRRGHRRQRRKATLMYRLAGEAVARGYAVITTSTTHLHPPTSKQTRGFIVTEEKPDWAAFLPGELKTRRHVTVLASRPRPDKLKGLNADELATLMEICEPDMLLMKADGARARLFKAPGDYEPVVPSGTTRGRGRSQPQIRRDSAERPAGAPARARGQVDRTGTG